MTDTAEVVGGSDAKLALMFEAATRLGFPAPDAAAVFSGLAAPFTPHAEGRSNWTVTGGHHWCTEAER
jgi:hypothetical protein